MPAKNPRVIIIGGVAGGASAAARLRRMLENAEILLVERGPDVSFANCGLPYHIAQTIPQRASLLVQTPESLLRRFNLQVYTRTEATAIDRAARQVVLRNLADGSTRREHYDYVVLSPGAEPVRPPLPGADLAGIYTLRSMDDMDRIKSRLDRALPRQALIVGGGYIGLEMAEALRQRQVPTMLVELTGQVMGPIDPEMATPLHQELRRHGVDLRLNTQVKGFAAAPNAPEGGAIAELSSGERVAADLVLLAIGVRPETTLARQAGLALGPRGGIAVNEHMQTSDPAILAVGDAVEVIDFVTGAPALIPLAGPANRQGRIAADVIAGRDSVYRKTQGTAICKVFDLAIATTGASEKSLRRAKLPYQKAVVHAGSHAGYYPGAQPVTLKLLFAPDDGRLLGAQAVGFDGVDKRIDVLATALRAGMTVFDLEHLELAYAPPYGSAKDPVNMAGFVAANALRGDSPLAQAEELLTPPPGTVVLDVRTAKEFAAGHIDGALHVPVDELRGRLEELPRDRELLVYCQVGLRGHVACRLLLQHGFRCRNVSGGYKSFLMVRDAGR